MHLIFILLFESCHKSWQTGVTTLGLHCKLHTKQVFLSPVGVTLAPVPWLPGHTHTHIQRKRESERETCSNPGWMTSPFWLGFLYDPGISHFPQQTSASHRDGHSSCSQPIHRESQQHQDLLPTALVHLRCKEDSLVRASRGIYFVIKFNKEDDLSSFALVLTTPVIKPQFFIVPQCLRCCHTTKAKWAATEQTARSAKCPLAADCRTQAPFSLRRKRRDPQSSARLVEPREVKDGEHKLEDYLDFDFITYIWL